MTDLAAGDRRALGILYERLSERVFRTAYRFLLDEDDARDVTQSVFVALLESASRYRPEAQLGTWLYRIVTNRCLNHRSEARRRLRGTRGEHRRIAELPAPDEQGPDQVLERAEERERVRAAMLRLPARQRIALVLRFFERRSYAEIAGILDCSRSSVESLLFRARRSLATFLGE